MFKVEHKLYKYQISYGDRHPLRVKTKEEVVEALKHYFVMKHNEKQCPACRIK